MTQFRFTMASHFFYNHRKVLVTPLYPRKGGLLKDFGFGITMTIIGMGVTFATLALLGLICVGLRKWAPYKEEESEEGSKE